MEGTLKESLLNDLCPTFWKSFHEGNDLQTPVQLCSHISIVFGAFHTNVLLKIKSEQCTRKQLLLARAALLLDQTISFRKVILELYTLSLKAYKVLCKSGTQGCKEEDGCEISCPGCSLETENCACQEIIRHFKTFNSYLRELGLLEDVAGHAVAAVVYLQLKQYVHQLCEGEFQKHYLMEAMEWMEHNIIGWLRLVLDNVQDTTMMEEEDDILTVDSWRPKLEYFLWKVYAELRITQLFEIIVEFPDSLPAIEDLKECVEKTESRGLLIKSLKDAFKKRLLHPAVHTSDILTQYVSSIRALRALDPSDVILDNVCQPLREYLRTRDDTIRCIIMSLTDQESGSDLAEELLESETIPIDLEHGEVDSDGEEWSPDPVDANPDFSSKSQRTADIINILVNIYGSKDLFVSEYRTLLADRMLTTYSYDTTNERRYLELLKRRFGELHLHFCDIMLKDIQDSQRINRHIKDQTQLKTPTTTEVDFNSFILSSVFWPAFKTDSVEFPEEIEKITESYTKEFEASKGMRTLEWIKNLGDVELEIELDDGKKIFHVTPAQATIILKFQDDAKKWSLNELCTEMKLTSNAVRSRLAFWINQGVIIEKSADQFVTAQSYQSMVKDTSFYEPEEESVTASLHNQREEELQIYWSYIVGMLTNIGSLPLDRIHSMLKMFAMHGPSGSQCTQDDVKNFLQKKVQEGELQYSGGVYKLPRT